MAAQKSGSPGSSATTKGHRKMADSHSHRAQLANIRHELRTPINAILGYSEMLLEDAADQGWDDIAPDLERIRSAGTELLGLVNDILDPAKIEAGKLDIELETVGANLRHAMLTPISAILGYTEMMLEDAPAGQEGLKSDLGRIDTAGQRFLELISDVVNFARLTTGELNPEMVSANSTSVESAEAVVRFLEKEEDSSDVTLHGRVLVVDDNEINRDVLSRRLERDGHTVRAALDGPTALEMVRAGGFDLVLLDVMMPHMSGIEVLEHLKDDPNVHDVPVIMISALDEIDSVVRCIELGAEDYLPKPFNPVLLKARIEASLEKKRLRDQEVEYLRNAQRVTAAAAAVEAGEFRPESLDEVAHRTDALGQLARVFQGMAREVRAREDRLKQQVQELRIQIDETKKAREVAEITDNDYFRQLQARAQALRSKGQ